MCTPFVGDEWVCKSIWVDFECCGGYTFLQKQQQRLMGLLVNTSPNRNKRSQWKDIGFCRTTEIIWRDYNMQVIVITRPRESVDFPAYD